MLTKITGVHARDIRMLTSRTQAFALTRCTHRP